MAYAFLDNSYGTTGSKQQMRSNLSRQKILDAVTRIVESKDSSRLNVRAICEEAGLSTGAFYHIFNSKEEAINGYLIRRLQSYTGDKVEGFQDYPAIKKITLFLNFMLDCYKETGPEIMSPIFSPDTSIISARSRKNHGFVFLDRATDYLKEGQRQGTVRPDLDFMKIRLDLAMLITAAMFYWCFFKGDFPLEETINRHFEFFGKSIALPATS